MLLEIFGQLQMGTEPPVAAKVEQVWSLYPFNRIAIVVAMVVVIVGLRDTLFILPNVSKCYSRWRWNLTMEHSMQLVRARDISALTLLLPFALLCARYAPIDYSLILPSTRAWDGAIGVGIVLSLLLIRWALYGLCLVRGRDYSMLRVAHRADFNYFILLSIVMLLTQGVLLLARAPQMLTTGILGCEIALAYLILLAHKSQILSQSYSALKVFLYLCALEFIPLGLVILLFVLLG